MVINKISFHRSCLVVGEVNNSGDRISSIVKVSSFPYGFRMCAVAVSLHFGVNADAH